MGNKHHIASPSSFERRYKCGASRWMHQRYADEASASVYADRGTDDHSELERCLIEGCASARKPVQVCIDHVNTVRGSLRIVEERFEQYLRSKLIPFHGGTIDVLLIGYDRDVLTGVVLDAKFGFLPVAQRGNMQVLEYVALAAEHFPDVDAWQYSVMQPVQHDEFGIFDCTFDEIDEIRQKELDSAKNREFVAGDHCRFCNAICHCPELRTHLYAIAANAFDDTDYSAEWTKILGLEVAFRSLFTEVRNAMLNHITKGGKVRGYKAVKSLGNRSWRSLRAVKKLAKLTGLPVELFEEKTYKSPAQVERVLKEHNRDVSVLNEFVHRQDKGLMLVTKDDRRKAEQFQSIEDSF